MPPGAKGWGAKMRIEILAHLSLQFDATFLYDSESIPKEIYKI